MKFDHIGLVAPSLEQGREALQAILEIREWTADFADPVNKVHVQFGRDSSGICYELIAPLGDDAPIAKALSSGRNILNHVAYLVPDLAAARDRLRTAGAVPTAEPNPAIAYGGSRIQFFVTQLRFIIELIEAPGHQHQYMPLPLP
jgi:methylmalonyl-CoA/ethylmalonyl-CoA epimerase